ncbi:RHS repeat-associated core domain-containing protein [Paucibacter sp. APW11]|uniref:RHS repeat-associated core domain-containing protein n=1 Tax=Roseateles aquae TaxID=3077235 RepID=A0ABU3PGU0_9BURK|nr:RHS repeat-associated core domain-containing protein [Paucibacter sp. APW11]MDT9001572.1 RHS repeat-associated core domain-containing protein [Paucibacter sp. APW11]
MTRADLSAARPCRPTRARPTRSFAQAPCKRSSNPACTLSYDPAGNTTTDSAPYSNAIYGLDGRLAQLEVGSAKLALAYDAQGQRVRRSISGAGGNPNAGNTFYAYDQEGQLLGEYRQDATGQLITQIEYVWLDGMPVAAMRPKAGAAGPSSANAGVEVFYLYSDHLGAPRVAVDDRGRPRWRWLAEPFGSAPAETDPSGLGDLNISLRLPGQQYDGFLGLHFNGFRDYDAGTGRYVQSDPIGLQGGINTYAYVGGNPIAFVDPLGLIRYNAPPPRTVPVDGVTSKNLVCLETCLMGRTGNLSLDLLVTGETPRVPRRPVGLSQTVAA